MGRKPKQQKKQYESESGPSLSSGIISILLVISAIIVTLSFFESAGTVGVMLNDYLLSFLFGSIRFITPLVLLAFAWYVVKDVEYDYRKTHGVGALLLFIALSGMMHMGFAPDDMWSEAIQGNGGGVFGMFAWVLKSYTGAIASWVIFIGLVIVSILLIFNTSITGFVFLHKKVFESFGALGRLVIESVKFLFVPQQKRAELEIEGDYEEGEEDEDAEVVEDVAQAKKRGLFRRRAIEEGEESEEDADEDEGCTHEDEEEYEEEEETEDEALMEDTEEEDKDDVWAKKVIVRDLPSANLLVAKKGKPTSGDIKANAQVIQDTLKEFRIEVDMGEIRVGPTVTQYSLKPAKGVKLSRITTLSNDLALALAAHPIRIEAPIPGKALVGVEVPNEKAAMVSFKELLESKEFVTRPHNMMIALGKDVGGKAWFADLPRMPHLLIAGATGSGKTVCMNTVIMSLLFQNTAEKLRMIMVDPKRVELTPYNGIPHLLTPVITNTQKTVNALKWAIGEMERRFEVMSQSQSRNIDSYNEKFPKHPMPHIVFVVDELADLMATAASEMEAGIIRLAQMARAVGIHLIIATQRPSVDVITGLMKANIPGRIAFSVASLIDSRTILDSPGAEKLLGRGDMLFQTAELSKPVRIQGAYISEQELKKVVEYLKGDEEPEYDESIVGKQQGGTSSMFGGPSDDRDPMFMEAQSLVIETKKASASFLQRRLKVGYARAARILDELEEAGIIGPAQGAKPREILVTGPRGSATMGAGGEHTVFKKIPTPAKHYPEDIEENFDEEGTDDESDEDEEDTQEDEAEAPEKTPRVSHYLEDEDPEVEEVEDDEIEETEDDDAIEEETDTEEEEAPRF